MYYEHYDQMSTSLSYVSFEYTFTHMINIPMFYINILMPISIQEINKCKILCDVRVQCFNFFS